ncbi:GIY-YIG nuclease family protein [Patescibacteria group bacterium]|nr:GIY-YIG nuclease family protein [Patescibacteria group bacterium]MBU1682417.1 GIY-YIG nuclease family protein [Patescibacteria group bacterium]MBU1935496.1 GIY-YIG nuclease family protein [Patescibacteria group bacterium]
MKEYNYYVYITTNYARHPLYTGVTSDLLGRTWQHKEKVYKKSYTSRYNCKRLVYYEYYTDIHAAIEREKQIKKYRREKKIKLIKSMNPEWKDLYYEILEAEYGYK